MTRLDMNMEFHQIELEEGSRDITTLSAGDSLFRYKRLSFGVNSAPEQYQNIIRQTIADCPGATNIADDIARAITGKKPNPQQGKVQDWSESNCVHGTAFK